MRLRATGDWTLPHYTELARMISGLQLEGKPRVDLEELGALDTAGATLLAGVLGAERVQALAESAPGLSAERRALLQAVGGAMHRSPADGAPVRTSSLKCWDAWAACSRMYGSSS